MGNKLTPKAPPGRRSRKALAYQAEIQRLHGKGYSIDAIREMLAEAGVEVSRSTVHREAVRPLPNRSSGRRVTEPSSDKTRQATPKDRAGAQSVGGQPTPATTTTAKAKKAVVVDRAVAPSPPPDPRSLDERAAQFMASVAPNPLLSKKPRTPKP